MRKPLRSRWTLVIALVAGSFATGASAMPLFTEGGRISCERCHAGPPRLNEAGIRFRDAGFRFESPEGATAPAERTPPIGGRLLFLLEAERGEGDRHEVFDLPLSAQVEAAGTAGKTLSFLALPSLSAVDGSVDLRTAWVGAHGLDRFAGGGGTLLNARAGLLEILIDRSPFSQLRRWTSFENVVAGAGLAPSLGATATATNGWTLGGRQPAVEAFGEIPGGGEWTLGGGTGPPIEPGTVQTAADSTRDLYARLGWRFFGGESPAPTSFSLFASLFGYTGRSTLVDPVTLFSWDDRFSRGGGELRLRMGTVEVAALALTGRDQDAYGTGDARRIGGWTGAVAWWPYPWLNGALDVEAFEALDRGSQVEFEGVEAKQFRFLSGSVGVHPEPNVRLSAEARADLYGLPDRKTDPLNHPARMDRLGLLFDLSF